MRRAEAADIEGPEIQSRIAVDDPVGHHPAGAARGRDSRRESAAKIKIVELGRKTDDRLAVGRDRNGPVDHLPDAQLSEHRDTRDRTFGNAREALEIRLQELRAEVVAN